MIEYPTNPLRAEWARAGLAEFAVQVGLDHPDESLETVIGDFLADLLHLCDLEGIYFEDMVSRARAHYEAEVNGDD